MRTFFLLLAVAGLSVARPTPAPPAKPDFKPGDILILADRFLAVRLQNDSGIVCTLDERNRECIMLVIYINGIRRAEYKAKYLDPTLFQPHSSVIVRTNFRITADPLHIRAIVNPNRSLAEDRFQNNALEKVMN